MKPLIIAAILLNAIPVLAQRNALSLSDRFWIQNQMTYWNAQQQYQQRQQARAEFAGALAVGVIGGLMDMANQAEQRKNAESFYNQQIAAMRKAEQKPRLMMWGISFRAGMRQHNEPEWRINHDLREQGIDPDELDLWEAAVRAATTPVPVSQPSQSGGTDPAMLQRIQELERRAEAAERKLQLLNTTPQEKATEAQKATDAQAMRRRFAEDLFNKIAEPQLSNGARAKRIRALGFDPETLKPLDDNDGRSSLAGR